MSHENVRSSDLIGSDRVEGTAVYGSDGDKIGTVESVLIEKRSGQARDVEISVGSFLGMGGEMHSLPWEKFDYTTYKESERDTAYDRDYQTRSYDYWAVTPYW